MSHPRRILLLLAALAFSTAASAQSTYRLTRIDPGVEVFLRDMNERGEAVGEIINTGGPPRAILLRDGMLIELEDGGGTQPFLGAAINDLTQVAGTSFRGAFLWENAQIRLLGTAEGWLW